MNTDISYGHVYVQFCNKWQTIVQKMLNEEIGLPSPISQIYGHMYPIWSCLCTILRQMTASSATKFK